MQKSYPINTAQVNLATATAERRNSAQRELLLVYQALLAQHGVTAGNVVDITATDIVIEVPDEDTKAADTSDAKSGAAALAAVTKMEGAVDAAVDAVTKPQLVV